jgi:hypothetical protein
MSSWELRREFQNAGIFSCSFHSRNILKPLPKEGLRLWVALLTNALEFD